MVSKKQSVLLVVLSLILVGAIAGTVYVVMKRHNAVDEATRNIFAGEPGTVTYTDMNGAELSLENFLGQVLVVTSWASWSPFTTTDLTSLNLIAADYPDDKVTFMAINRKETKDQAARFLSTAPNWPEIKLIIDTQDRFYNSVEGYAMPETIVFNQKGQVVLHLRGQLDPTSVRQTVDTALSTE